MDEIISVIVPVYNVEQYLPRCLQAISEQTYTNLEIILVDDGSTDRSGIICDDFAARDPRVQVIHQPNTGLWAARNAGHDVAHGEYLFFPDGDDYFHQDLLRILHDAINQGDGYDLAICQKKRTQKRDEDASSPVSVQLVEISQDDLFRGLFKGHKGTLGNTFSHNTWNKLYRRRLVESHRNKPYPVAQDRDFLMRLYVLVKKAILVNNILYYWVQRPGSLMHSPSYPVICRECRVKMVFSNYLSLPEEGKKYGHYFLEDLYTNIVFWKGMVCKSPVAAAVFSECNTIIQQTRQAFISCREISLWKRAACLFLAHCPRLTHWLIKASGN